MTDDDDHDDLLAAFRRYQEAEREIAELRREMLRELREMLP
ncbi:hypothetical protein [Qipengyuania thermophila]|nr:hypothetical protein [Qipengyuania thermophila]